MTPELWRRINDVLEQVESAPTAEREAKLDRLCGGDVEFRRELAPYLVDCDAGTFLHGIIREQAVSLNDSSAAASRQERFGHYQVVRRIGQGGMGAVFEAVRIDDFHKKVALKIIKQGLDSDLARARFLQERQLLARLEHPYIARLLDGGETADGSPYLVLEFVDGEPITRYCGPLDRTARLRLFLKVCEAVEHAHRNLVVHRDLKPANILVTATGHPKLLDFGIAKLLDPGSSQTLTAFVALTPDYASPEQVRGEPITTASDVYSLGVILYQVLTGRKPYALDTMTALEMDRIICQQPPAPPGLGDELDHILLMALRKEPERRYAGVQRLSQDIERYLEHRPVQARPDTVRYRAKKFARRNWWQIAALAAMISSLSAGLGFTIVAQKRADRRFNQVRQLANRFLFDFNDQIANTPGTVKARELIVSTALEYLSSLEADAHGDAGLQWELAAAYSKVGMVQGSTARPSLHRAEDAMASYDKALALVRPLARANRLDAVQRVAFVDMLCDAEGLRRALRQYDRAAQVGREAVAISAPLGLKEQRRALNELAITLGLAGDLLGSVSAFERMLPVARETARQDPSLKGKRGVATTLLSLGNAQFALTSFGEATASVTESNAIYRELFKVYPAETTLQRRIFLGLITLGQIEGAGDRPSLEHPAAAVARFEEALHVIEPLIEADPADRASRNDAGLVHDQIAYALREVAPLEAVPHAAMAAKLLDAASPGSTDFRAEARIAGADGHRKLGHAAQAELLLNEAERILKARGTETEADLDLAWARLETIRATDGAAASRFAQTIALDERLYAKAATPASAWALTRALDWAALAMPASARSRRERIVAVWAEMNRRFPGRAYIGNKLREAERGIAGEKKLF